MRTTVKGEGRQIPKHHRGPGRGAGRHGWAEAGHAFFRCQPCCHILKESFFSPLLYTFITPYILSSHPHCPCMILYGYVLYVFLSRGESAEWLSSPLNFFLPAPALHTLDTQEITVSYRVLRASVYCEVYIIQLKLQQPFVKQIILVDPILQVSKWRLKGQSNLPMLTSSRAGIRTLLVWLWSPCVTTLHGLGMARGWAWWLTRKAVWSREKEAEKVVDKVIGSRRWGRWDGNSLFPLGLSGLDFWLHH